MGPAELLDYDRKRLRGHGAGGGLAHRACRHRRPRHRHPGGRAREQACSGVSRPRDPLIIDGDNGTVFVRPGEDIRQNVAREHAARCAQRARPCSPPPRDLPAVTPRRRRHLAQHQRRPADRRCPTCTTAAPTASGSTAPRSRSWCAIEFPDVAAQTDIYRTHPRPWRASKPVVFRTLDVGGDKVLPYWRGEAEENPAMGWRAIRIGLDRPIMLRQQSRALIRGGRPAARSDVSDDRHGGRVHRTRGRSSSISRSSAPGRGRFPCRDPLRGRGDAGRNPPR